VLRPRRELVLRHDAQLTDLTAVRGRRRAVSQLERAYGEVGVGVDVDEGDADVRVLTTGRPPGAVLIITAAAAAAADGGGGGSRPVALALHDSVLDQLTQKHYLDASTQQPQHSHA